MSLENKYYLRNSDSSIKLEYKSSQEFQYIAENSQTIVTYMSSIGGLISLWFGLAFIDLAIMFKIFLRKLKYLLLHKLHLDKLIKLIKSIIMKILLIKLINLIHYLEQYNWRKLLKILCIPLVILQFFQVINTYIQFMTKVRVEIIPYIDSDDSIGFDAMPAITLCVENTFEHIIQEKKSSLFSRLEDQWINHTLYDYDFHLVQYNVYELNQSNDNIALKYSLNETIIHSNIDWKQNIIDYYYNKIIWDNSTDDYIEIRSKLENQTLFQQSNLYLFNNEIGDFNLSIKYWRLKFFMFDLNNLGCKIYLTDKSLSDKKTLTTHCREVSTSWYVSSPFGKCSTYLYTKSDNNIMNNRLKSLYLLLMRVKKIYHDHYFQNIQPIYLKIIVHHAKSLPIQTNHDMKLTQTNLARPNSIALKITMVKIERLQYPYDTNCKELGSEMLFDCLNKCHRDQYLKKLNCVPFNGGIFTFKFDDNTLNETNFCNYSQNKINFSDLKILNQKIKYKCSMNCGTPCNDTYYYTNYHEMEEEIYESINLHFYFSQNYYLKVIYQPKTTFYSLIIDLANAQSFWYGFSLIQLFDILFQNKAHKILQYIINKMNLPKLFAKIKVMNSFDLI